MKRFILISLLILSACNNQAPVSQAPIYNFTYTDNSQYVIGDNNSPTQSPNTSTEQSATPNVNATADSKISEMWKYWLVITIIVALFIYLNRKRIIGWFKVNE